MEIITMSSEKFESRLEESLQDYKDGKVISAEDLIDEIEGWN